MERVREDLLKILNQALELEHAAIIQYSTRAEMITATLVKIEKTHQAKGTKEVLGIDLNDEKEAIAFYKLIRNKVGEYRKELQHEFERLDREIRNVINDEQEHLERLSLFVEQLEEMVEKKKRYGYSNKAENLYATK